MVVVWCVAGFLAVTMIIVGIYYTYFVCCQTRKKRKNKRYEDQGNLYVLKLWSNVGKSQKRFSKITTC